MRIKVELTFPGELKEEPIICYLCKTFNIALNIVEASFSTDTGWAILVFEGEEDEIAKTLKYLKDKGIDLKNLEKIK